MLNGSKEKLRTLKKLRNMKFKNRKGKRLKTTMSNDIMNQVAEITELQLKNKNIFYLREGTVFKVKQSDMNNLLNAQMRATKKLIKDGVITLDMIKKDMKYNFG